MMSRVWKVLTSLRLTVMLLALSVLLVFFGTLAQVDEGLWRAQEIWFRSFVVVGQHLRLFNWHFPVPLFPGGYLIGYTLLLNLTAAFLKRFQWRRDKIGIHLIHSGVILLLLGQLLTDTLSNESHLRLKEGETKSYSEAHRKNELIVASDAVDGKNEQIVSIPESFVKTGATIQSDKLPVVLRIKDYAANCDIRRRGPMVDGPSPATEGLGKELVVQRRPETHDMDSRNIPFAYVEVVEGGRSLGTWLVTPWLGIALESSEQHFTAAGKTYRLDFRSERYYKPFSVTLLKATHEIYRGTDIPKNFRSRVRVENPERGENREVDIDMNHPLRYAGLTFYQYQMGRDEVDQNRGTSTLQVVRNPGWLAPYAGCYVVAIGMYVQFRLHLVRFLGRRVGGAGAHASGGSRRWTVIGARLLEAALLGYLVLKFTFNLFGYA
jgi:hypothetical protein